MHKNYKNKYQRNYELIGKLIEELKLRKYSYRPSKNYRDRDIVIKFLKSGKSPRRIFAFIFK